MFLWLVIFTLWPFDPKTNGFPEHFFVKYADPSCTGYWDIVQFVYLYIPSICGEVNKAYQKQRG